MDANEVKKHEPEIHGVVAAGRYEKNQPLDRNGEYVRFIATRSPRKKKTIIAFPGVTTLDSFEYAIRSPHVDWPNSENSTGSFPVEITESGFTPSFTDYNYVGSSDREAHSHFYDDYALIIREGLATWLRDNVQDGETVVCAGHSRGGAYCQFLAADIAHLFRIKRLADGWNYDDLMGWEKVFIDLFRDKKIKMNFEFFGTPNAGNTSLTQTWCEFDFDRTSKSSKGLKRFYITKNHFEKDSTSQWVRDAITASTITIKDGNLKGSYFEKYHTLHPRGISRKSPSYIADHCSQLKKIELPVKFKWSHVNWLGQAWYAVKTPGGDDVDIRPIGLRMIIHGTSFYLSGLEDFDYRDLYALWVSQQ